MIPIINVVIRTDSRRPLPVLLALCCLALSSVSAQTQQTQPPVPKPFPGQPSPAQPATTPPRPGPAATSPQVPAVPPGPTRPGEPTAAQIGVTLYPTAEYLESFDAGRGQRYYLYGTSAPFLDIVAYYRKILNNGGNEVFKAPAIHRFDLPGKFQEETMAFPPSVVVKDYTWGGSEGYLFVDGTREKRYRTIIQIVPSPPPPIK